MTFKTLLKTAVAVAILTVAAPAMAAPAMVTPKAAVVGVPASSVDAAGRKVAAWQLAHMDNFDYVPVSSFRKDTEAPATGSRRPSISASTPSPTRPRIRT
ncbi:hypothetical protein [Caulobacter sp. UC70_42]|uniref:hypothetical protein n=1 Tax=Caulobacter sp. UC70_42 TaxID=3374551 RepID=UPI003757F473